MIRFNSQFCNAARFIFSSQKQRTFHLTFFSTRANTEEIYYPDALPPKQQDIDKLNKFVAETRNLLVVSGAGLSTESGIPDYRSKDVGLYDRTNHKPMNHRDFISSHRGRQKYWGRNYLGWARFASHWPNAAHLKLSELEKLGKVHWHVSQNVDGLLTKAGSTKLTELHGCMNRVVCLNCNEITPRQDLQQRMAAANTHWAAKIQGYGPDADVFLNDEDVVKFEVPSCRNCGGILKPDVVFFGDNVPLCKVDLINDKVDQSDGLLVVGSSLHVWSGYKFIVRASNNAIPIVAINVGPTRADLLLSHKINALCTKVLSQVLCI